MLYLSMLASNLYMILSKTYPISFESIAMILSTKLDVSSASFIAMVLSTKFDVFSTAFVLMTSLF